MLASARQHVREYRSIARRACACIFFFSSLAMHIRHTFRNEMRARATKSNLSVTCEALTLLKMWHLQKSPHKRTVRSRTVPNTWEHRYNSRKSYRLGRGKTRPRRRSFHKQTFFTFHAGWHTSFSVPGKT